MIYKFYINKYMQYYIVYIIYKILPFKLPVASYSVDHINCNYNQGQKGEYISHL